MQHFHKNRICFVIIIYDFSRVRKTAKSNYSLRHDCLPVHIEKFGLANFHEIEYLSIFRKPVGENSSFLKNLQE